MFVERGCGCQPEASLPTENRASLNQHSSVHLPVRFVPYVMLHGKPEIVLLQTSRHLGTQPVIFERNKNRKISDLTPVKSTIRFLESSEKVPQIGKDACNG